MSVGSRQCWLARSVRRDSVPRRKTPPRTWACTIISNTAVAAFGAQYRFSRPRVCHRAEASNPPRPSSDSCLENRQTITLGKHAVFDPDQLLLDNECPRLRGKQLQRRPISQRGFWLAQPSRGIRGLSSEDLLGAGRDARNTDSFIGFLRGQQCPAQCCAPTSCHQRWVA